MCTVFSNIQPAYAENEYLYKIVDATDLFDSNHKLEIKHIDENNEEVIVGYCFQMGKMWPKNALLDTQSGVHVKYKKLDADANSLSEYIAQDALIKSDPEKLKKHIGKIVCLGYPRNEEGLLSGFTEQQQIDITQYAVWWFTNVNSESANLLKEEWVAERFAHYGADAQRARDVLLQLISDENLGKYENVQVNVFVPENDDYQVVLSVEKFETDRMATGKLLINKAVEGSMGDYNKEFIFKIYITDENGKEIEGQFETIDTEGMRGVVVFYKGAAVISLKHSESVKIADLPNNFKYSVTETNAKEYFTYCSEKLDDADARNEASKIEWFEKNEENRTVVGQGTNVELDWVNINEGVVPTGVDDFKVMIPVLLLVIVVIAAITKRKRCGD